MSKVKIFHNPRCSKSREALQLLNEIGCEVEIVEYLKAHPSKSDITELVNLLGIEAHDLVRTGEAVYKEHYKGKELTNDQWIEAMTQHPVLIERPIVIHGNKAVIGRPPVLVKTIL